MLYYESLTPDMLFFPDSTSTPDKDARKLRKWEYIVLLFADLLVQKYHVRRWLLLSATLRNLIKVMGPGCEIDSL
jgi:hypothetical protein